MNTAERAVPVNLTVEWYLRSSPCYDEVFGLDVSVYLPKVLFLNLQKFNMHYSLFSKSLIQQNTILGATL